MREQITQAELQAVLDDEAAIDRKMLEIRRQLKRGATIEPGQLTADFDGDPDGDELEPGVSGFGSMGVSIFPTKTAQRIQQEVARKREKAAR